jgi:biotin carboxyl carrier protein
MGNNRSYRVKVNDFEFSFGEEEINAADIIARSVSEYNLVKNHHSVNGKILDVSPEWKKIQIEIEGDIYKVEIKDELDQMLDKMGFGMAANKKIREIKAPMPGLVLEINVKEGQQVQEGDKILILEAMKMENSILIHADAMIKKIAVLPGQAVDKGQVLVELE